MLLLNIALKDILMLTHQGIEAIKPVVQCLILQGCYSKIMARSSQGHIKVKSGQAGENSRFLVFLLLFYGD